MKNKAYLKEKTDVGEMPLKSLVHCAPLTLRGCLWQCSDGCGCLITLWSELSLYDRLDEWPPLSLLWARAIHPPLWMYSLLYY